MLKASAPPPIILPADQTFSCLSERECTCRRFFFLMPHLQSNKPLRPSEAPSLNVKYSKNFFFFFPLTWLTASLLPSSCSHCRKRWQAADYIKQTQIVACINPITEDKFSCGLLRVHQAFVGRFLSFIFRGRYRIWHRIINASRGSLNRPPAFFQFMRFLRPLLADFSGKIIPHQPWQQNKCKILNVVNTEHL